MPLKTDTFGITRHWLSVALQQVQEMPDVFAKKRLSIARRTFLAGSNQLVAIKNWLVSAEVLEDCNGGIGLSALGQAMAARDAVARQAWTWWLFHLHLCANVDAYPYGTFFRGYDADGASWLSVEEIVERLTQVLAEEGTSLEAASVTSYFQGVEQSYRPGGPLYDLQLIEYRTVDHGRRDRLRRCAACPADIVVAYGTLLFQHAFYPDKTTVEARMFLDKGLARSLGMNEQGFREALGRIHHHPRLSEFVQYRGVVNLDSVQFMKMGPPALKEMRSQGYASEEVRWP
jgi:hypothetical protein